MRRCSHSPPSHHLPCSAGQGCAAAYPHLYPALPYSAGVAAAATVCAPPFALTPPFALSLLAPPAPFGRLEGHAVAYLHLCPTLPYSAGVVAAAPVHAAAVLPLLAPLPYSGLRVARCGYSYSKGLTLLPHSSGAVAHSAAGTPPPLAPLLALAPLASLALLGRLGLRCGVPSLISRLALLGRFGCRRSHRPRLRYRARFTCLRGPRCGVLSFMSRLALLGRCGFAAARAAARAATRASPVLLAG